MPRQTRPRMVVMSFRLPEDIREQLDAKAAAQGMNPTEIVRALVADYVTGTSVGVDMSTPDPI